MINQDVLAETIAFVQTCNFPCTKQDLLMEADEQGAPDEVYGLLDQLPDQEFLSETLVIDSLQGCV